MASPEPIEVAGFPGIVARGGLSGRPPVVLLHSAFADHRPYEQYVARFAAAGFDCYAISRRGRAGRPASELDGVKVADYHDDAVAVLEELDGEPPIVIGHSLGGVVGQKLAEEGRCARLVLLAAAPPWLLVPGFHSTVALATRMPAILAGRPFMITEAGAARLLLNGVPAAQRAAIHARFPRESGATFRELLTGRVRVNASKVTCPVLYLHGDADRVISGRTGRHIAKSYGGDYLEYPGMGHWLAEEPGWEGPAGDIIDWINAKKGVEGHE